MDNYEFNAPTYIKFDGSMDLNDGADKCFDGATSSVTTPVKLEPPLVMDISSTSSEKENELCCESSEEHAVDSKEVDEILQQAMKNLWSATKRKKIKPNENKFSIENMKRENKRKGSPIVELQPSKYISMAEAVHQFHTRTPQRFHTRTQADKLSASLQFMCPQKKHKTLPYSPNLKTLARARPVHVLSREQQEQKEVEEMKLYQVKARPLNPRILEPPKLGVRVEKKPHTIPEPFKLTDVTKKIHSTVTAPLFEFKARPAPTKILKSVLKLPERKEQHLTSPISPICLKRSQVYATCLDVKDGKKCLVQKEVHNFGVPTASDTDRKRFTEVQPFSFEERDREFLRKKEEKIQKILEEENKVHEFHAHPIPVSVFKLQVKSPHKFSLPTLPVPFHLSSDERGLLRQEQFKQKLEEEAKELAQKTNFKANPPTVIYKKPFEPKKSDRALTDITTVELNTEKRAKEREEYDKKVRLEQKKLEELIQQKFEMQKKEEEEEVARIRKESVHKANPVRRYKKLDIQPSSKPLTDPESPSFFHH